MLSSPKPKNVQDMRTRDLLVTRGFVDEEALITAQCVSVYGTRFTVGEFIILKSPAENVHGMHSFAKVTCIVVANDGEDVWLEAEDWLTEGQSEFLHAYQLAQKNDPSRGLHDVTLLPFHPPLSGWRDYTTENLYVSLKYFVP